MRFDEKKEACGWFYLIKDKSRIGFIFNLYAQPASLGGICPGEQVL
jgi:hypothetical protein